ncbi:DNA-directed DNA polymerase [Tanacetum coccineum]
MESLSEVSTYLNELESTLDDEIYTMMVEELVEVEKKAKVDDAMDIVVDTKKIVRKKVKQKIVMFTKAPYREYDEPFMRFSTLCEVEGNEAMDAKLTMAYIDNYMSEDLLNDLGYVRLNYDEYGRKMIKDIQVAIYVYDFEADFVVVDYVNEEEPSIVFGRSFLVNTKSQVDFGLGEMKINITMLKENKDVDALLENLLKNMVEVKDASGEQVKMGKANRLKNYNVNKLTPPAPPKIEEIPKPSSTPSQPIFHQLSPQQKEKILEALKRKYHELTKKKPVVEVLENYMMYCKKLDEVMMGNFVLPFRVNGTISLSALAGKGASVSVLPYTLYMNLRLVNPRPYHSNLTMADNIQAKAMGEVRNVRIQIGYQAYLADFLVLDIPIDKELPLLLGPPFLRTCGAMIDMGHGTMTIDDGVIKHTYYPQPMTKVYLKFFENDESEDWMSCFEVGRDEYGNPQYDPVAPSFLDIKDEMERALALEAYFNPFKNIFVFKKLIDFLGSLPVSLKNNDWGF